MKKFFLKMFTAILTLALILPMAAPVMADSEPEVETQPAVMAALMVRNPSVADVSQPVTITVFGRYNHVPVAGAAVYALKADEMAITADKSDSTIVADYAAIAAEQGIFLGYTGDDGRVRYQFTETGKYLLVAIKNGFAPGFSRIVITLSASEGLSIRSPQAVNVGETFTMKVIEKFTGRAVEDAAVYAKKIRELDIPEDTTQIDMVQSTKTVGLIKQAGVIVEEAIDADSTGTAEMIQYAADIRESGIFIGYTDDSGEVDCTFDDSGIYVLVAIKDGYAPGFARIKVRLGAQKTLGIKAPDRADVDDPVTIKVFDRGAGVVVGGAAVYALKIDESADYPISLEAATSTDAVSTGGAEKYATMVTETGFFIGYTNDEGQVVATFDETGRYVLVATKEGYKPGLARIIITLAAPAALVIKAPREAHIGQRVTIAVYTRQGGRPVEGAAVYALKWNVAPSPVPVENGTVTQVLELQPDYATEADKYAAMAREDGEFIGHTNSSGQVFHAFDEVGRYTLVAIEDGYVPAFTGINIKAYGVANPQQIEEVEPVVQSTSGADPSGWIEKPKQVKKAKPILQRISDVFSSLLQFNKSE